MTAAEPQLPVIVVMGVSGSGKSTVGGLLAERLGVPYAEADDFHPPANIAKMSAGHPLDDADREPWLDAIAHWIAERRGQGGVVSCSALRRRYRDRLRATAPDLFFVHLDGPPELNLWVRTAPRGAEQFHWHVDIAPRLTIKAGFELGTGVDINVYPPERAASDLRECL